MHDDEENESDYNNPPDEDYVEEEQSEGANSIFIPTVLYYHKTYAMSCGGEDQRAVRIFRDYESPEKLRRLQRELMLVKDGKIAERICDRVIGKKRRGRFDSYERWAQLMLLWITSKRL